MTIIDWRVLPASTMAALYRREWVRWRRRLSWDTSPTWDTVETARVTWGLPGIVYRDASGRIRGWTFYLVRNDGLDVGGFVAEDTAATGALADALLERARTHGRLSGFIYAQAAGLDTALVQRGVRARPFLYLVRDADAPASVSSSVSADLTPWPGDGQPQAAQLLQCAYGSEGRIYAPRGQLSEWEEYVKNLVGDAACGRFSPSLSRLVARDDTFHALAVVTAISRRTAHLAQIAVHPSHRRRSLAQQLLADVLAGARREGFSRMSLLVSAENTPARELYRRFGFAEREKFVAIERP